MNKKIGVIIPVHNSSQTLDRCLQSIVYQTYKNLLIILVENGSQDNSLELCNLWAKKDNRVVVLQSDKGVSKARNAGIDAALAAQCDYIAFCDADDYVDEIIYQKLVDNAIKFGSDIVFCNYIATNDNGQTYIKKLSKKEKRKITRKNLKIFFYPANNGVMGVVWRCLFKSSLCCNMSFNEDITVAEDLLFLMEGLKRSERISFVDEVLYVYIYANPIKKYNGMNLYREKVRLYEYQDKLLSERKYNILRKFLKVNILLQALKSIIKTGENYKEEIKELLQIPFYAKARSIIGLINDIIHAKGIRTKIADILLYLGLYDIYSRYMKKVR